VHVVHPVFQNGAALELLHIYATQPVAINEHATEMNDKYVCLCIHYLG
jgi:hypothetical protein